MRRPTRAVGDARRATAPTVAAAIVVVGVVGAVGVVVVREARRSGWRVLRERVRRSARMWRLAARRGIVFAGLRTRRATDEELDAFHIHTAEQVFELLGGMKGAVMKLGQLVSFIADGLPEAYAESLRGLQQQAPPMAGRLVAEVVRAELGREPEAVFDEFDPEPVAAASIGQVHRARLFDGTRVAVKLQYPGVDVAIRADLDNAFLLYNAARLVAPGMEPGPMVDELRERMGEELDYRLEAANQEAFRRAYDGHPWARIPAVHPGYSTARVLTSDWVEGRSFYELLTRPQAERDRMGERLFRFWGGSVTRLRLFNGDPHPGNYFFAPEGTIWFLDFGLVKRFEAVDVANLGDRIAALRSGDDELLWDALVRHGWVKADAPLDHHRAADLARLTARPFLEREPFTYTREYNREVVQGSFLIDGPFGDVLRHVSVPRNQLILTRIQIGLGALLARLGATADWASIMDEYLFGEPPSTPAGEEVAAWPLTPDSTP